MNLQKSSMKSEVFWIMKSVKISLKPSTKYPVFSKILPPGFGPPTRKKYLSRLILDPPSKNIPGYATDLHLHTTPQAASIGVWRGCEDTRRFRIKRKCSNKITPSIY